MKKLPAALIIILALALAPTLVHAGEPPGTKFAATSQATEDDRLPIYPRDEWQFFVSPYLWIPGVNINTNVAGRTTSIDVPWWDIAGKLFSEATQKGRPETRYRLVQNENTSVAAVLIQFGEPRN